MSGSDRRDFVKQVAVASAAVAAASVLPDSVVGEGVGRTLSQMGLSWQKTPCLLCGVGCGLEVAVENGRAVAARGDADAPVNGGLACAKGYHAVQALYGQDRLSRAMVRRDGRLVPVPIQEALDLVARRLRETRETHGKDSVALYGSGQWTIPAGYVASKLFKGALGTNNLESDTRLSSAAAASGLATSFGLDHATGCYEDIDHADVFVIWNTNIAETQPVLFSRMLERRRQNPSVHIIDLGTRTTRTSYAADRSLLYTPQAELAVANAICHEIIAGERFDRHFVETHVAFKRGRTGIGYGLSGEEDFRDEAADADWSDYVRFLRAYTPERAEAISGLPAADIRWLASVYADPSRKVLSVWGTQLNQHTRGTWVNNLIHNIHLLVGKIASPGTGTLPLVSGPGDCGTAREVGTLTHTLPRGVVTSEEDRARAARIWGVPADSIDPRPTHHALSMFRALDRGDIRFMWIQGSDPMLDLPNVSRYRTAARREDRFLVVSDVYPTPTTDVADVVLPSALWIEQRGMYGNPERRTQYFPRMVQAPGEAMSHAWQLIEVARRLGFGEQFPWNETDHVAAIWAEYRRFNDDAAVARPPLQALEAGPGVLWPYVEGRETRWRYHTTHDPAADGAHGDFDFYGHPDHRAWIWLRPYEAPPESPDAEFPFWLETGAVMEHTGTGSLTRRIPVLHRAVPKAYVELNREDAAELGIRNGDRVRLVSRRGSLSIEARIEYRSQPSRRQLFVPAFDESHPVNELTLDAYCPISGQPDHGKVAVRVERIRMAPG